MKRLFLLLYFLFYRVATGWTQCAMCTKTAQGLDDGSAQGLNNGIVFLAVMPLSIILLLGFIWWKKNKGQF